MAKSNKLTPLAATVSAAFMATAMGTSAQAAENPFATTELNQGYELASKHKEGGCGDSRGEKQGEGKCGEGKAEKKAEGKCGEGKCGEGQKDHDHDKTKEGKCGEGKCGG